MNWEAMLEAMVRELSLRGLGREVRRVGDDGVKGIWGAKTTVGGDERFLDWGH